MPGATRRRRLTLTTSLVLLVTTALVSAHGAAASTGDTEWTRQFGPTDQDTVGLAIAADGSVYVTGQAREQIGADPQVGDDDAFVRKYSPVGAVLWTRQFGSADNWTYGYGIAVAPDGSVYVVGTVTAEIDGGGGQVGSDDAYVRKYDAAGTHVWTRQFGGAGPDGARAVTIAPDGSVFIAGYHSSDVFLARYDAGGSQTFFDVWGTGSSDGAYGMAVGTDGTLYIAGDTDGTFAGETSTGGRDAFLRKYDISGENPEHEWTRQFGSTAGDSARTVVIEGTGIYVGGSVGASVAGQTHLGESDAFLRRYDSAGNAQWTRQFGTASFDFVYGAAPVAGGGVYVVGSTRDALVIGGHAGDDDAFIRRYSAAGDVVWTRQFGTADPDEAHAAAAGPGNTVYVAGSTNGGLVAGAFTGPTDFFVRKYSGSPTVGLFDPSQGQWHLRNSSGDVTSFYFGNPGDYPIMGDWDCNGTNTPGMYRQSNGLVYLRNTNTQGNANIQFFFGNPGDIPIVGDFNNNGCDTVSIYRPSNQTFYIINQLGQNDGGLGAADLSFIFGNPGDKPFVGDFNGNGQDTIGLHRESTGFVYFRNTLTTGVAHNQFFFGNPNDRFITGDWNTNGIDSPGIYRPGNTTFYFRHTNTQGNADHQFQWGQSGWLPVSGHFGLG